MRKFLLSVAAVALVASPALAGKYNKKVSVGDKAPTFSGIPATTPKGEEASLSLGDMKEDVVVLVFLAARLLQYLLLNRPDAEVREAVRSAIERAAQGTR